MIGRDETVAAGSGNVAGQLKTPVVFMIFNRPDTTGRVFEEIARQKPETLLVIADGPREGRSEEAVECARTREVLARVDWPCRLLVNFSEVNLGCKARISSGLDWVFTQVEEAIILEDDCLPHPDFFRFCEEMLQRYRDDSRVMMVGGTNYLLGSLDLAESYCFSRYFAIWGWATWRRAWNLYDLSMSGWENLRREGQLASFYRQRFMRRVIGSMFDEAAANRIDTWDIQWFFSCLFNNGVSVIPKRNLISNIGVTGTHTTGDLSCNFFPVFPLEPVLLHPERVFPNRVYDERFFRERLYRSPLDRCAGLYRLLKGKTSRLSESFST